jgi:hypothetical protein
MTMKKNRAISEDSFVFGAVLYSHTKGLRSACIGKLFAVELRTLTNLLESDKYKDIGHASEEMLGVMRLKEHDIPDSELPTVILAISMVGYYFQRFEDKDIYQGFRPASLQDIADMNAARKARLETGQP